MLIDATMSDLTSENGVPHLMPANPSGSELGLKADVDFCAQPKIPTKNDKTTAHFRRFLISDISVLCQTPRAFLPAHHRQL